MSLDTQTLSPAEFDGTDSSPVIDPAGVTDGQDDGASPEGAQNTQGAHSAAESDGKDVQALNGEAARAAGDKATGDKAEAQAKARAEEQDKQDKLDRLDRLDRHPRFQELVREKNTLRDELKVLRDEHHKVVSYLNQQAQVGRGAGQGNRQAPDYAARYAEIDRRLEAGQISLAQARQAEREVRSHEERERAQVAEQEIAVKARVGELHQSFKSQNPDFAEIARSDDFKQAFKANPMHDTLSAYYATKYARAVAGTEQAVKQAVAKAIRETEERITKNNQAKRTAASLGAGPRGSGYDPDAMLQDTSRHGGRVAVGAARLRAMRAQAGG
ncbi:hypothetical protein [Desulfocurvibacter africanus]|uniref:Uncharacterized protein n=1 Tax=Desulfocurvibacter africanus subsp. africanus str. Walvis Bay TaxID=690850 RepID=F3YXJ8_DESAF|nr:hypothetical protein [Desulfocurvibacter africanus]EGJ51775.1 hypothetical protein Desaf_3491 [Desulfocurvibacter africanus subsp. africanus str. Walvis Bay]